MRAYQFLTALLIYSFLYGASLAQDADVTPEAAAVDMCASLLEFLEKDDYTRVGKVLVYLDPVLNSIDKVCGTDLATEFETGVQNRDARAVRESIRKVLFCDMLIIFNTIEKEGETRSRRRLRAWLKVAYSDYLLMSAGKARKIQFEDDRVIKKTFRRAYAAVTQESPFADAPAQSDIPAFAEYASHIAERCLKLFPELAAVAGEDASQEKGE